MVRTGFVVQKKRSLKSIISVYDYLKANDPVSIDVLGYLNLFDETDYLASPRAARYEPMNEKLTRRSSAI